jgi:hypothetical protein
VVGQLGTLPPPQKFVREVNPNGLIVSTCFACQTVFASTTPTDSRMAEAAHKCRGRGLVTAVEPSNGNLFERNLCEQGGRTLIESHCKRCGQILLGTAIFGDLLEQEQQHTNQCV